MSEKAVPDPEAVGWVQDPDNPDFWVWAVTEDLVEEAPDDGAQYGRESKSWTEIVMPEIPEIPEFVETDPTVPDHVKAISTDDLANWSASYSWGDHSAAGYATEAWVNSKGYLTSADKLWTDISSETGNNTIERFGDEVWVSQFKSGDIFAGAKLGNDIFCSGKVTAGTGVFVGGIIGLKFTTNDDIIPVDASGNAKVGIDLGTNSAKFKNGAFSGDVSATSFSGDGSALTGIYDGSDAVKTSGNQSIGGAKTFSSNVTAPDFVATSDRRVKKNIVTAPTDVIDKIRGVEFEWKSTGQMGSGVIAQELEEVPELAHLVHYGEEDGTKHVSYLGLIGYLIEEVKYLKASLEELK